MGRLMLVLFLVVAPMALIYHAEAIQKSYTMNISKNGKDYLERIKVDTKKGTESSQVREASSGKSAGESITDFNRKLTMTRLPGANACFLSDSTQNAPRPAELIQVLKLMSSYTSVKMNPQTTATYKAIGKLDDRSKLSQEMRDLCANLTIYRVVKQNGTGDQKSDSGDADPAEVPAGEGSKQRRGLCRYLCHTFCWYKCGWGGCSRVCKKICSWIC